ncbi:MAG: hypothetical protein C4339_00850 [Nitrososphaerota archaeon]
MSVRKLDELLRLISERTGRDSQELLRLIDEKRERIGGGYLSRLGAAYLVAADLGVRLEPEPILALRVGDLTAGLRGVTVIGRVLTLGPTKMKQGNRDQGGELVYRKGVLYDERACALMIFWERAAQKLESLQISRGDALRVSNVAVTEARDYHVTVHVRENSVVEKLSDIEGVSSPKELATDVSAIGNRTHFLVLRGIVAGKVRGSMDTEGKGLEYVTFGIRDVRGVGLPLRVLFRRPPLTLERISEAEGRLVYLYNVRVTKSSYGGLLIKGGDESDLEVEDLQRTQALTVLSFREDPQSNLAYLVCRNDVGELIFVEASRDLVLRLGDILDANVHLTSRSSASFIRAHDVVEIKSVEGNTKASAVEALSKKIADIGPGEQWVFLPAITLSGPMVRVVKLSDGKEVEQARILIGDSSGEVELVAWGSNAHQVKMLRSGQKVLIRAAKPKMFRDRVTLEVTKYTMVQVLSPRNMP